MFTLAPIKSKGNQEKMQAIRKVFRESKNVDTEKENARTGKKEEKGH